jgi:subtilisin
MRTTESLPRSLSLLWLLALTALGPAIAAGGAPVSRALDASLLSAAEQRGTVRVIVTLNTGSSMPPGLGSTASLPAAAAAAQNAVLDKLSASASAGVRRRYQNFPVMAMEADAATLNELAQLPEVRAISEDRLLKPHLASSTPVIGAPTAWAGGYAGNGQMVAILNTGVETTHPYFAGKIIEEACFSSTYSTYSASTVCPNGQETQYGTGAGRDCDTSIAGFTHGTHVGGIAVGNGDGLGRASGVAKDADILAIQVFSRFDSSTYCGSSTPCALAFTSDIIAGLDYVYSLRGTYNIAAANMSLGGGLYDHTSSCDGDWEKSTIDTLRAAGIATVIAAGNEYADY